ncbi:MAG: adenylate cyclase [Actinomycetota bacterium]|jgi:adenylate cyclase|nr:adenylate cyclase [Actinomycetota bacterium]
MAEEGSPGTVSRVAEETDDGKASPREAGRRAVDSVRRGIATRVVGILRQRDPELLASLTEVGVVSRDWVEGGDGPVSVSAPIDVIERLLERSVERRPSLLANLGLSAIQVLSSPTDGEDQQGTSARLTVAFTDLEGFTRFTAEKGDEQASRLLSAHHRTVGPVVRSRGGRVVKRLGDGLLLTFPEPEAAVLSCLELVAAQPAPLRLRAGAHVGDVVVTRDDVIGHTVNVAARVAESAKGGEVLVTTDVRAAVKDSLPQVRFTRARTKSFKGVGTSIGVCRALPA